MTDDKPARGERRGPDDAEGPGRVRRANDSTRVRAAIRTELDTHGPAKHPERPEGSAPKIDRKPGQTVISLENVSLAFDEPVLEDVSFAVKTGETVVVVGESGSG